MFLRLILLVIVVAAVLWILKRLFSDDAEGSPTESKDKLNSEDMRQCKYCGTHVPESLLIISNDQPYCCQDHADRDQP